MADNNTGDMAATPNTVEDRNEPGDNTTQADGSEAFSLSDAPSEQAMASQDPAGDLKRASELCQELEWRVQLKEKLQRVSHLKRLLAGRKDSSSTSSTNTTVKETQQVQQVQQGQKRPRTDTLREGEQDSQPSLMSTGQVQGQKRPRAGSVGIEPVHVESHTDEVSNSTALQGGGEPPDLGPLPTYHGKNVREYRQWLSRMQTAFALYPDWFSVEFRKVATGTQHIGDHLLRNWIDRVNNAGTNQTWAEFTGFLLNQLDSTERLQGDAYQKYIVARQHTDQTVRDFSAYLTSLDNFLPTRLTEGQRMVGLKFRILAEIRDEINRYNRRCTSYDEFVEYVHGIEMRLPGRKATLTKLNKDMKKPHRPGASEQIMQSDDNIDATDADPKERGSKGDSEQGRSSDGASKGFTGSTCFYCNELGHSIADCREKAYDETTKGSEVKEESEDEDAKRLDSEVLCAAGALDSEPPNNPLGLVTEILIHTPEGRQTAVALIDLGATANFISQRWAEEKLPNLINARPRQVKDFSGHDVYYHGQRYLDICVSDRSGFAHESCHGFYTVDMTFYDVVLGHPWILDTSWDLSLSSGIRLTNGPILLGPEDLVGLRDFQLNLARLEMTR